MGVYVKGMKMPKSCSDCLFFADGFRDANDELCSACLAKEDNSPWGCGYKEIDGIDHMARRMDYCPLVEVPEPHGDLIDRGAFKADYGMKDDCAYCEKELCGKVKACEYDYIYSKMDFCGWLDNADVVIEAEGE